MPAQSRWGPVYTMAPALEGLSLKTVLVILFKCPPYLQFSHEKHFSGRWVMKLKISQLWVLIICGDVIKWRRFQRYWPFVRGIHQSPVKSPHKGQWRGTLTFSFICTWINAWENNREAGDLRRHHTHYDVTVMCIVISLSFIVHMSSLYYWIRNMIQYNHSITFVAGF